MAFFSVLYSVLRLIQLYAAVLRYMGAASSAPTSYTAFNVSFLFSFISGFRVR